MPVSRSYQLALTLLSCAALSGVLLFAAADKVLHLDGFIRALQTYPAIGDFLARFLAGPLIVAEAACAVGLWLPRFRRTAAWSACLLLAVFSLAVAVQQWLVPGASCGCWFSVTLGDTRSHLLLNLALIGLAASVALTDEVSRTTPAASRHLAQTSRLRPP